MNRLILSFILALGVVMVAFTVRLPSSSTPTLPSTPLVYPSTPNLPPHMQTFMGGSFDNTPPTNRLTDAGAALGRVLFYDTRLSGDETLSCASCHLQALGFTDSNTVSTGINGAQGSRNSMGLANARFYNRGHFFWDERAATLEDQVLLPIEEETEMGASLDEVIARLEATTFYPDLFADAFGTSEITSERMSLAMAQFVRSIISYRSRYDEGRAAVTNAGRSFPTFTSAENRGKALFNNQTTGCKNCHVSDAHILSPNPQNNGLDSVTVDPGVGGVTGRTADESLFKVPSLRNIALTAPYMHDGRFRTLEEVIEHYNSGVQAHPNLSPAMQDATAGGERPFPPRRLNLTDQQKSDLLAFLLTLTDAPMTTDVRWSDPFTQPLTLAVTPHATTVPASGGTITADITVQNAGATEFVTTPRATLTMPNGRTRVITQPDLLVAPGASGTSLLSVEVLSTSRAGTYTVVIEAGGAPSTVSFTFEKLTTGPAFASKQDEQPVTPSANASATAGVPTAFALHDAFPNPFSQGVTVRYDVPKATDVTVEVMDLLGRRVAVLAEGPAEAGTHTVRWEPTGLPVGVYVVRALARGESIRAQRVTLVR